MADDTEVSKKKSRTLGSIDAATAKKIPGWDVFHKRSEELSKALKASKAAKKTVRDHIVTKLGLTGRDIDFTPDEDGNLKIVENLVQKDKARSEDLSKLLAG